MNSMVLEGHLCWIDHLYKRNRLQGAKNFDGFGVELDRLSAILSEDNWYIWHIYRCSRLPSGVYVVNKRVFVS